MRKFVRFTASIFRPWEYGINAQYVSNTMSKSGKMWLIKSYSRSKAGWMNGQRMKQWIIVPFSPHQPHEDEKLSLQWWRTGREGSTLWSNLNWVSPSFSRLSVSSWQIKLCFLCGQETGRKQRWGGWWRLEGSNSAAVVCVLYCTVILRKIDNNSHTGWLFNGKFHQKIWHVSGFVDNNLKKQETEDCMFLSYQYLHWHYHKKTRLIWSHSTCCLLSKGPDSHLCGLE